METLIQQINNITSGTAIIVGKWSRKYNGYLPDHSSNWISISINSSYVNEIKTLGIVLNEIGQDNWGTLVDDQFFMKTPDGYRVNVYVTENTPEYTFISGSRVETPAHDLNWHIQASGSFKTEYLHNLVQDLQLLYGGFI